jgi:hypothetical protein
MAHDYNDGHPISPGCTRLEHHPRPIDRLRAKYEYQLPRPCDFVTQPVREHVSALKVAIIAEGFGSRFLDIATQTPGQVFISGGVTYEDLIGGAPIRTIAAE